MPGAGGPFPRVLWALDRSPAGARGDPIVATLVRQLGAGVTVCHTVFRPTLGAADELDGSPAGPEEVTLAQELRARVTVALGAAGRDAPIRILHGDPGQRVCEYAEFLGTDLIVLGPRSPGSLARALRGSVSRYVLEHSRRHVLILGDPAPPPAARGGGRSSEDRPSGGR